MDTELIDATQHHPLCNFFFKPRDGCRQCADLYARYHPRHGEAMSDIIERCFPNARVQR